MKVLVVYDSKYGNTEKVARAIGEAVGAQVHAVGDLNLADINGFDLLILGSPTHGGFPTEGINNLSKESSILDSVDSAAFDTRTKTTIFGYAAPKIARNLKKNGANLWAPPEGFFVLGTEGPLMDGELERATNWGKEITGQWMRQNSGGKQAV